MMLVFLIAHVYMGTMGKNVFSLLKPMIIGYGNKERTEQREEISKSNKKPSLAARFFIRG